MSECKRIFIVGHSGAGKGVLAKAVAKRLGWKYIDADFSLAPSIGRRSIEILGEQGAVTFQSCLSQMLAFQVTQDNIVVTTDDSIVCDEKSIELLSSEMTVYLAVSTSVQIERIGHNRPLLPIKDYANFLDQLRLERDHLYKRASCFSLSSDDGEIELHAAKIIKAMHDKEN